MRRWTLSRTLFRDYHVKPQSTFRHGVRRLQRLRSTATKLSVADILERPGDLELPRIEVNAFVRSVRRQKTRCFAAVGDGTALAPLQAVLSPDEATKLSTGAAVRLKGRWVPSSKQQAAELLVDQAELLGENDAEDNPLQKKYQTPEFLRTIPHLRTRIPHNALILRFRSAMIASVTRYFEKEGFIQTHTPIITSSDCEGSGEVFEVDEQRTPEKDANGTPERFFDSPKYLTVSSQLHLEALAQSVGKVWTLSPTFRAEKSNTARHLSEFYMLEAEQSFITNLEDVMNTVEKLIRSLAQDLMGSRIYEELQTWHRQQHGDELENRVEIQSRWRDICRPSEWPRITYHRAIQLLQEAARTKGANFGTPADLTSGLQTEHERYLAQEVGRGAPVFVTDYPKAIKPFYMAPSNQHEDTINPSETVACFDLLMPDVCEVVGGSMREHRLAVLKKNMEEKGLSRGYGGEGFNDQQAGLQWYLDLRRYGSVPHGGFGLGLDRLLGYLTGTRNLRDVVTFPRWHKRCSC